MSRGIYAESGLVALAVEYRQAGVDSRLADDTVARACREAHRIAVSMLARRSPLFGAYIDRLNSQDEANETALAILERVPKLDVLRGGTAVVNCMVTIAMNGIRNRIRNSRAARRFAETVSFEELEQQQTRRDEDGRELAGAGLADEDGTDGGDFGRIVAAIGVASTAGDRTAAGIRAAFGKAFRNRGNAGSADAGSGRQGHVRVVQTELELVFA